MCKILHCALTLTLRIKQFFRVPIKSFTLGEVVHITSSCNGLDKYQVCVKPAKISACLLHLLILLVSYQYHHH